ncbi:hypothetical protein [Clostridium estertheticum]|nr:hypothetical protein [Clostridium estertheticum]
MTGFSQNVVSGATAKTNMMNTITLKCNSGDGITAACDSNIFTKSQIICN